MRRILIVLLAAAIVLTLAPSVFAQATKILLIDCDELGNVVARWELPGGAPAVGDIIKIRNKTIDKITNVAFNGVPKINTLPLGALSGAIGQCQPGVNFLDFCARCDGARPRGDLGCVHHPDILIDPATLSIDYGCGECEPWHPTLTQWVLIVLVLSVGGYFVWQLKRRRKAVVSVQ